MNKIKLLKKMFYEWLNNQYGIEKRDYMFFDAFLIEYFQNKPIKNIDKAFKKFTKELINNKDFQEVLDNVLEYYVIEVEQETLKMLEEMEG